MRILLKTTLKNIFGKPFRSLLVTFSIFVCALAALFCFDLSKTETDLIKDLLQSMSGEADFGVTVKNADIMALPEDLPENTTLAVRFFNDNIYKDVEGEYYIVSMKPVSVYATDITLGSQMGYFDFDELGCGEAVITDQYADNCGLAAGDKFMLHDSAGDEHEFTVKEIVPADIKNNFFSDLCVVVNNESGDVLACGKKAGGILMVDICDDSKTEEAESILKDEFSSDNVRRYALTEDMMAMMNELYGFLFILFAVTFLLVIFITFSICERIVGERMSYIGTLRSLGLSSGLTGVILLSENVLYALIGSIPGVLVYNALRGPMMDALFTISSNGTDISLQAPELSAALVLAIILGAVLIECLIPLKAILKALNTSIRDIIFDNRDTEYKFSRTGIITGIVLAVISLISLIFSNTLFMAGLCLITAVMALAFLFPLILKAIASFIRNFAEKRENGKLSLAAVEAMSRKSTVSSGVLCVTSATMCIIIYVIATSMMGLFNSEIYDCDTIVTCMNKTAKHYSFIEHLDGVTDVEYLYSIFDYAYFGDDETEKNVQLFGLPEEGFRFYNGIHDLPETLENGTICVEKGWASKYGYRIGDTFTITFHPTGVFPIRKDFTIASYFTMETYEAMKNNFVISLDDYKDIEHDVPGYILIRTDDPEGTTADIKKYAVGSYSAVQTREEMIEENKKDDEQSRLIFTLVIAVAMGMTCIGMVSNQLIGFEGRKKECAVMISTSMSKKTLAGVLFREMFITAMTSVTSATIAATAMFFVIKRAVDNAETLVLPMNFNVGVIFGLWVIMTLIFALTVLFPIRHMRKMKLAEQLKYE